MSRRVLLIHPKRIKPVESSAYDCSNRSLGAILGASLTAERSASGDASSTTWPPGAVTLPSVR
jgi:hypothetical protein